VYRQAIRAMKGREWHVPTLSALAAFLLELVCHATRSGPAPSGPVRAHAKHRRGLNTLSDAQIWTYADPESISLAF
jgi:hypothetical protein